jgi:hypothetical protein
MPDINALFPLARHLLPPTNTLCCLLRVPATDPDLLDFPRSPFSGFSSLESFHSRLSSWEESTPTSVHTYKHLRAACKISAGVVDPTRRAVCLRAHSPSPSTHLQPQPAKPEHGKPECTHSPRYSARENPLSEVVRLGQSVSLRKALHSLSSKPSSKRRPWWTRSIFSGGWPKRVAGLRSIEQQAWCFLVNPDWSR